MKKVKLQKPSWKRDNSVGMFAKLYNSNNKSFLRKRVKENNKIAKFLKDNGWKYWDSWNIYEHGYTLVFHKDGLLPQNRPLSFSWYWDNNGGDDFFVGALRSYYDLHPNDQYWHPAFELVIDPILPRFLKDLPKYEKRLVASTNLQMVEV